MWKELRHPKNWCLLFTGLKWYLMSDIWSAVVVQISYACNLSVRDSYRTNGIFTLHEGLICMVNTGKYGCFLKWWYPQNIPKWSFLAGKPMVLGYHHFRKPPYTVRPICPMEQWYGLLTIDRDHLIYIIQVWQGHCITNPNNAIWRTNP